MYDPVETNRLLEQEPWATELGVTVGAVSDSSITLQLELTDDHLNFLAGGHGGVLFSLGEVTARVAAIQRGPDPTLLDAHLVLTAGGEAGDVFSATVTDVKVGRTLGVFRVEVTRTDGRLVGDLTTTMRFVDA